jgi:hypothetical protein
MFKCRQHFGLVKIPKNIKAAAGPSNLSSSDNSEMSPAILCNLAEDTEHDDYVLIDLDPHLDIVSHALNHYMVADSEHRVSIQWMISLTTCWRLAYHTILRPSQ